MYEKQIESNMRTKLKLIGLLLAPSLFLLNAQTITVTSETVVSGTFGGSSSVHVGALSGNGTSSTGDSNTFLGESSGKHNTIGSKNLFSGTSAGQSNTTGSSNIFNGVNSGFKNTTGNKNTFTGVNSGYENTGSENSFYGYMSGSKNTTGSGNAFFGYQSGRDNINGAQNTFIGYYSGLNTTSGSDNTYLGWGAGPSNTTGSYNTYIGRSAGTSNVSGQYNTIVGALSGSNNVTGQGNVFLGFSAGGQETGSNKLYIANSNTTTPLIWGDFDLDLLKLNGKVGIGFDPVTVFPTSAGGVNVSNYKLYVAGGILAEEIRVNARTGNQWADYVFDENYELKPLNEVEEFIKLNGHLPNIPCAEQIAEEGIELSSMIRMQQEKIEELMLYLINQNKEIENLKQQVEELKTK